LDPLKKTHFSPATVVHFVAALDSRTLHHATGRYHNATLEIHQGMAQKQVQQESLNMPYPPQGDAN
jgi:hypothetical protein